MAAGEVRILVSLRAVGEGHRSSIEFRTGVAGVDGRVRFDDPAGALGVGRRQDSTYERQLFHAMLGELGDDGEDAAFILDALPDPFTGGELDAAMVALRDHRTAGARSTIRSITSVGSRAATTPSPSIRDRT